MTELSPQAQAVLDAFRPTSHHQKALAAALRAAADEVVPEPNDRDMDSFSLKALRRHMFIRNSFFDIATELENCQ